MKTLYLIRHAKSSWDLHDLPDIDRPLNERGYRDAHLIGGKLLEKAVKADLIISSPANRAISTALIIAREIQYIEDKIVFKKNLYETSADKYISEISLTKDSVNSLMLFGHNPIISETAMLLGEKMKEALATCAVVGLTFKIESWKEISENKNKGELVLYLIPKVFRAE
jgi:phosphohistidine phosphatase